MTGAALSLKERRTWRRWFVVTCRAFGCSWQLTYRAAALWEQTLDEIDKVRKPGDPVNVTVRAGADAVASSR